MNKAKWIQSPNVDNVSCFKKIINLNKNLKKATLKITSMGFYRVYINKKDISDNIFMPGWTSFLNRVQYQTYDITHLLRKNNVIDILLSEGFGGAKKIAWPTLEYPYFKPSLIFVIELEYIDGSKEYIRSDNTIDVYSSFVISSSIYNGEVQNKK